MKYAVEGHQWAFHAQGHLQQQRFTILCTAMTAISKISYKKFAFLTEVQFVEYLRVIKGVALQMEV